MSDLVFEEATHSYYFNQVRVPSVTEVISMISGYDTVPRHILDSAAAFGNAVHKATELYDRDDLDYATLDEQIFPYLLGWQSFLADTMFKILEVENRLYHQLHRYAGTSDRVGLLNGELVILDIKTTAKLMPSTAVQLAAYQAAYNSDKKKAEQVKGRYALQLKADETYRLEPYNDKSDFATFLACLQIYQWRQKNA